MSSQTMKKLGSPSPRLRGMWLLFRHNTVVRTDAVGAKIAWMSSPSTPRFAVAAYNLRQLKY
ncbi:MAG: LysR family transcriptional regulator, partial [Pseudomonas sp.]|nr:LysR family transcriptional regulator [Pseudomonas sp.]